MKATELQSVNSNARFVAHRGYSARYPENTLTAIQAALDENAKYLEIDIQLTKDGHPVLFHDRDLGRLCQRQQSIHNYTLEEIECFSSFSPDRFGDSFKGEKIPRLIDVVNIIKKTPDVTLFVELKRISIDTFGIGEVLNTVLPVVEPIIKQCVFISFSLEIIEAIRKQTSYPVGTVFENWCSVVTTDFERVKKINPQYIFCDINSLPENENVKMFDSLIVVYECADFEKALAVFRQGVDLVETFDIKSMAEKLDKYIAEYNGI